MKKQNFQYLTGLIVLGTVLYAAGFVNVFATFFSVNPGAGYTCSGYGYISGYGYGQNCSLLGAGGSSVNSVKSTTPTSPTTTPSTETDTPSTDAESSDSEGAEDTTTDSASDTTTDSASDSSSDEGTQVDEEVAGAYDFGFENGLTTLPMEKARLYDGLNRSELAKMMSNFIKNVVGKDAEENPVCDITTYADYATFDDEMKIYIKMACDYGIMGWKNDKSGLIESFRPLESVTREEFAAVLSRYLFGSEHDGKDMKAHLEALKDAGIMNQIDNPYVVEIRGYVLLMLQRASEEEVVEDEATPTEDEIVEEEVMEDEAMTGSTVDTGATL